MTAEVAVLNKSAVALAADSAMTVGSTRKTYPTNKLFALTKYRPVGVMVYNNAEFMGIPWETLVKMHREECGSSGKATVKDYAENFLGYVGNAAICTSAQVRQNFLRIATDLFPPPSQFTTAPFDRRGTESQHGDRRRDRNTIAHVYRCW